MVIKKDPSRLKAIEEEKRKKSPNVSGTSEDIDINRILDEGESEEPKKESALVKEKATVEEAHQEKFRIQETRDVAKLRKLAADASRKAARYRSKNRKLEAKAKALVAKAEKNMEKASKMEEKAGLMKEKSEEFAEDAKVEEGSKSDKYEAKAAKYEAKRTKYMEKAETYKAKAAELREKALGYREKAAEFLEKVKYHEREEREYTRRADRMEGKISSEDSVKTKKRL